MSIFYSDPNPGEGLEGARAGVFPTGRYRPLAAAALGLDDPREAWGNYLDLLADAVPNEGEVRLFPLIAHRLGAAAASVDHADWLSAARRAALFRTTGLLRAAAGIAAELRAAQIPFLFSKGIAMVARVYPRPELRPFSDIDLHVPETHASALYAFARAAGWTIKPLARAPRPAMYAAIGSTIFVTPGGTEVDVHWRPRRAFAWRPALASRFHADAHTIAWRDREWPIPSDSWLLIETLEHGVAANAVAPIRWLVDSWLLLHSVDARIDWDLVQAAAAEARMQPAIASGVAVLAALGAPVPEPVTAALRGARTSRLERIAFRLALHGNETLAGIPAEAMHYLLRGPGGALSRLTSLPRYLRQDVFEYPRWRDLWRRLSTGAR